MFIAFLRRRHGERQFRADHAEAPDHHWLDLARAPRSSRRRAIAAPLLREVWPLLDKGKVKPEIYKTFPLAEAAAAHRLMESSAHIGKIVLTVSTVASGAPI